MSAPTLPTCPLGLTADDLSAWRDHAHAPADERRITAHASACPACQRTIAAHDALASALRAERLPAPDPLNWSRLQQRIAAERSAVRVVSQPRASRWRRAAVWSGLGAAVAALVISALFFTLFGQLAALRGGKTSNKVTPAATPAPLNTVAPTTPVTTGAALSWRYYGAPASVVPPPGNESLTNTVAFAPTDPRTAYICADANGVGSNPIAIWATHDGAHSWTQTADRPNSDGIAQCMLTVDALDSQRINLFLSGQNPQTGKSEYPSYMSDDGGKTWSRLEDDLLLTDLATRGQTSVAVVTWPNYDVNTADTRLPSLAISHDGFRTSTPIDSQFTAQGAYVSQVWQRPSDGALLALVVTRHALPKTTPTPTAFVGQFGSRYTYTSLLWQSDDLGAHWTPFPTPPNLRAQSTNADYFSTNAGYLVAQPTGAAPWHVCGYSVTNQDSAQQSELVGCTLDGGKTWTSRPLPSLKDSSCGSNCLEQQTIGGLVTHLMSDGSLLSVFYTASTSPTHVQTPNDFHLFRLALGAIQWQDLGPTPGGVLIATNNASGGVLVSFSGGSFSGYSGSIVGHIGGPVPNRGLLAYADLP